MGSNWKIGNWTVEIESTLVDFGGRRHRWSRTESSATSRVSHLPPESFASGNTRHLKVWAAFCWLAPSEFAEWCLTKSLTFTGLAGSMWYFMMVFICWIFRAEFNTNLSNKMRQRVRSEALTLKSQFNNRRDKWEIQLSIIQVFCYLGILLCWKSVHIFFDNNVRWWIPSEAVKQFKIVMKQRKNRVTIT